MAPIRPPPPGYGPGAGGPSGVWGGTTAGIGAAPTAGGEKFLNFYIESTNGKFSEIHGINFPKLKKI